MKKLIAVILSLVMCFALASTAFAAEQPTTENESVTETVEQEDLGDILGSVLPENDDPELEKLLSVMTKVATYVYNYATQPEEPAVDLETVITIVTVVVTVIYTLSQNA